MTVAAPAKIFADRIGRIEVSATMAVAAEAAKLRAQGANLVDFGAGEPHFCHSKTHKRRRKSRQLRPISTRYTVVPGIPDVRKAIVERHACDFGSEYTVDEAIFTTGGKLALFNTHPGAGGSRRRGDSARSVLGQLQRHHPVRGGQGRFSRDERGGEFSHHGGRDREGNYAANEGDHPEFAVESGRVGGVGGGSGADCSRGARARDLPAAG